MLIFNNRHLLPPTDSFALADRQRERSRLKVTLASGTRPVKKSDIAWNSATPHIDVDPETFAVRADGELLVGEPATVLPMAQRYFLF